MARAAPGHPLRFDVSYRISAMNFKCRHCSANNSAPGYCVLCRKQMGSLKKAFDSGLYSSLALATLWSILAIITGIELSFLAIIFGGLVSAAVVRGSSGRGISFQLIATSFTLIGIVASQAFTFYFIWDRHPDLSAIGPRPGLIAIAHHLLLYDDFTLIFIILGVMGGAWVWHHGWSE
jgi:hypothetical protein